METGKTAVNHPCSAAGGEGVGEVAPEIAKGGGDFVEYGLFGGEKAVDVKHVGVALGINGKLDSRIDKGGDKAAEGIKGERTDEAGEIMGGQAANMAV